MISFKPINLDLHKDKCISFREDSFIVSFGDAKKFHEDDGLGAERYIDWLKAALAKDPKSIVHAWKDDQIIGQIELGRFRDDSSRGYVNLYYLVPEERGKGFGVDLDRHAMTYFKSLGLKFARLSVSPSNARGMAYYKKMNWKDLGPRPGHPEIHYLEKVVE